MTNGMLKQTRLTILLSLNAAAIVIAGILIASAIGLNEGIEFRVVSEYSDVTDEAAPAAVSLSPESTAAVASYVEKNGSSGIGKDPVPNGQLWNEDAISMYQTAD